MYVTLPCVPAAVLPTCSAPAPLGYTQPSKLPTPPKGRQAAQLPSVTVPPLKLGSAALAPAASASAAPAAALDENRAANAPAAAAAAPPQAAKGKKGALRFLPGKKVGPRPAACLSHWTWLSMAAHETP